MRLLPLLVPWLLVIWCEIVFGKFVKIENLHSKEDSGKSNWDNYGKGGPVSPSTSSSSSWNNVDSSLFGGNNNRSTIQRSYRYGNSKSPGAAVTGTPKLLQSVNEVQLDSDLHTDGFTQKEWKSFYYPHHGTNVLPTASLPFGWSINNNNLLNVPYTPMTSTSTDLAYNKPAVSVQCLLFGVMGLVTFLLNSVMGLLLSVKLPGLGLDGLLGPLLGFGAAGLGAFTKQDALTADTGKAKSMVHFPETNDGINQSAGGGEFVDKNR